jgi:hypothetical protein
MSATALPVPQNPEGVWQLEAEFVAEIASLLL